MKDKTATRALVTGASSPVGAAIARRLAGGGHHVILHAHANGAAVEALRDDILATGGSAETLLLDLTDPASADVIGALAAEAPVQVFVHAVGQQRDMPFAAMEVADWTQIIDVNLNSFFIALRPLVVPMMRARWGRIVAISSLTAVVGNRGQANYAAAKGGLVAVAKTLAREYGSRGITANVVAPGLVDTPATRALENYEELTRMSPARRAATPDEVAALVCFVTSRESDYLSGQLICLDGGMS
ncbi:MAG: SDR family NAD(P)-dependent oxidoreductase [Pseudomonadota bacterium]